MRTFRLLVLHGPLLEWLGEPSLAAVNRAIESGLGSGAEVRFAQGSEAELVAAVHRSRDWASHALVSPSSLAQTAYLLRDALALIKIPFAEIFVNALPASAEHAQRSVLRANAQLQRIGAAPGVYLDAAEKLLAVNVVKPAAAQPAQKQVGRVAHTAAAAPAPARTAKTIGHVRPQKPARGVGGISRASVRQQIADRLSGRISAAQLASWGREQWLAVEGGAATEAGQRELLAEALQALAISAAGPGMSEPELVEWMARMG